MEGRLVVITTHTHCNKIYVSMRQHINCYIYIHTYTYICIYIQYSIQFLQFFITGVLLRVRSTRIVAVYVRLHEVSLPIYVIVIANDIITC